MNENKSENQSIGVANSAGTKIKGNNKIKKPKKKIIKRKISNPSEITAYLAESSLLVFDIETANFLYSGGRYFGKPLGIRKPKPDKYYDKPLELTLIEGYFLLKYNKIKVFEIKSNSQLDLKTIGDFGKKYYSYFMDKFEIYEDLRLKGYIVRSGLKFGADFAVYKEGPGIDHSPYLIQVVPKSISLSAIDIVKAGRLATSVKKRFILANALNKTYYGFKWFKP